MKALLISFLFSALATITFAQDFNHSVNRLFGRTVYIDRLKDDLDGFLAAEFVRQELPFQIVSDARRADYILTGSRSDRQLSSRSANGEAIQTSTADGYVVLQDKATGLIGWAGRAEATCSGASTKRCKQSSKLAREIVQQLNHDIFLHQSRVKRAVKGLYSIVNTDDN